MSPTPFEIAVPDEVLDDLHKRLANTRFPASIEGAGWSYGTDVGYLQSLVDYWRTDFNWREAERRLNELPQYRARIQDVDLHFVHVPGKGPAPTPLLFVHGWPGSFSEVSKIIGPLTDPAAHGGDPENSFSVVAPSLPGFGFSSDIGRPGMNPGTMAEILAELMTDVLGYSEFVGQGGDWGSTVLTRLAHAHPDLVTGLHLNYSSVQPSMIDAAPLSAAEQQYLSANQEWSAREGAYNSLQSTKPQSLAVALNDSPAGLAAWLVEKYRSWSDCNGDVESSFSSDELLTQVMIYWVTQSIGSSSRLYAERAREGWTFPPGEIIDVPTAYARFPAEIRRPPAEWLERMFRLERFTDMPRGGQPPSRRWPSTTASRWRSVRRGAATARAWSRRPSTSPRNGSGAPCPMR